jgi:hypothetical protein
MKFASLTAMLVVALLLTARSGLAQGGGAAAAETMFNQGRTALEKGDYAAACTYFRESDRLDPAPGTKLNLADCEEKRGRIATAWELFRAALQDLPASDERHPIATQRAAALEKRLPKLTMTLAQGAPANTSVKDGDVELGSGTFGVALPLDPGKHRLVVSAPGHEPKTFDVELSENENEKIEVAPGASSSGSAGTAGAATSAELDTGAPSGGGKKTLGYVLGGIGVLGLAVGTVTGIMVLGKKSTAEDHCDDALRVCDQTGKDANDSGRTLGPISTIGFAVGVVGLGAGTYFILSSKSETAVRAAFAPGASQVTLVHRW